MADPTRPPEGGTDPVTGEVTPPVPPVGAPREPVLSAATWVTLATAVLALLTAFAVPIDDAQQAAILGAIAVVAPVILAIVARQTAWSPQTAGATVRAEVAKALKARAAQDPPPGEWLGR